MTTLPKLAQLLFEELHNTCFRLHDDATQALKAKHIARTVFKSIVNNGNANLSTATFRSNWVCFTELPVPHRKTKVIAVHGIGMSYLLGHVRWWNEQRCYGFFPAEGTVFNVNGMQDIQEFVQLLMSEWAANREQQKQPA